MYYDDRFLMVKNVGARKSYSCTCSVFVIFHFSH